MSSVSVHNINIYDNPFIIINMLYSNIPVFINMSILCTLTEINIHSFIPQGDSTAYLLRQTASCPIFPPLRFCTDVINSRDIYCCRHVGCQAIHDYIGLVHWEPGHIHVWCTTNTKYIGINDIKGHTCVAVIYNSRPGRDKTVDYTLL